MSPRVGLFGFGRAVKEVFFGSKETRRKKVLRRSCKLKNRWAPEFLEVGLEDVEPPLPESEETNEIRGDHEAGQERNDDAERNS